MSQIMSNQNVHQKLNAVYYNRASHEKTPPSVSRRAFILPMPNHPPRRQSIIGHHPRVPSHRVPSPPHPPPPPRRTFNKALFFVSIAAIPNADNATIAAQYPVPCHPSVPRSAHPNCACNSAFAATSRVSCDPGHILANRDAMVRVVPPLARCDARHRPRPAPARDRTRGFVRTRATRHATGDRPRGRSRSMDRWIDRSIVSVASFRACVRSIDRSVSIGLDRSRSVSIGLDRRVESRAVRSRLARPDASTDHDSTACPSRPRPRSSATSRAMTARAISRWIDRCDNHPIDRSIDSIRSKRNDNHPIDRSIRSMSSRSIDGARWRLERTFERDDPLIHR